MKNLNKEEWKYELAVSSNAVILDVRTPEECAEGIQENAQQLNFLDVTNFQAGIQSFAKEKVYFVYCRSGVRSAKACLLMKAQGLNCYNLIGGMLEWDGKVVMLNH